MVYLFRSLLPLLLFIYSCQQAESTDSEVPEVTGVGELVQTDTTGLAKATFAGGCFWCTEAYFERVKGVGPVISGYTGGKEQGPTYKQVSAGKTTHAEAVQVYYNPKQISYQELVDIFFATHDPTTLNRQGPDWGAQYRSAVYYRTASEKQIIENHINKLNAAGKYKSKIVTQVEPFRKFWPAEKYHQDYYLHNPRDPYVVRVARPKVLKFEKEYASKLKPAYLK